MGFFFGKDGRISVIRTGLFFAALGAIFIAGALISVSLDQESRRTPFDVELPPNAEYWGPGTNSTSVTRSVYYRVPGGEANAIADFYQQKMDEHYGNDENTPQGLREICQRSPSVGEFNDYEPDNGNVPYLWQCFFDRTSFRTVQTTLVTIHPGVPNDDPNLDSEGYVVIEYDQEWSP